MKKIIMSLLAAATISVPALADPIKDEEYFTMHSMGCMLLQECTDHVKELKTVSDLNKDDYLVDIDYDIIADKDGELLETYIGGLPITQNIRKLWDKYND